MPFFIKLTFPGVAEAELEHDIRSTVRSQLYTLSGDFPVHKSSKVFQVLE